MTRTAIITGGANGIGFACVRRFLEDGFNVVLADNNPSACESAQNALASFEDRLACVVCDVSEKLAVHNLLATTLSRFGEIDVLVNNAAIAPTGSLLDTNIKAFNRVMKNNLLSAFIVSQAVARQMINQIDESDDRSRSDRERYAIVNVSSVNARVAMSDFFAVSVSKGGLNQMTKAMALELAQYGIRVNGVGPGSIKTAMLGGSAENDRARATILSRTPMGRLGTPDDIAGVVAFLSSSDSRYMTGETIYVDGGRLALNYVVAKDEEAGTE